jgi:hypothetical protein
MEKIKIAFFSNGIQKVRGSNPLSSILLSKGQGFESPILHITIKGLMIIDKFFRLEIVVFL